MSVDNTRRRGSRCWVHDACETCFVPTCPDCPDVAETCPTHQEAAA